MTTQIDDSVDLCNCGMKTAEQCATEGCGQAGCGCGGGGCGCGGGGCGGGGYGIYDLAGIRSDFPILQRKVNDYPLAYLDSANTSQKPIQVLAAVNDFIMRHNANTARAMHTLGVEATAAFEGARGKVAAFIGAAGPDEVVFTKNATEALNLAANTLGAKLGPGDEIVISEMEHHSNIVPWQFVCERTGAKLRWFSLTDEGRLDLAKANAENLINERTKIVSLAWVSNVLGTINPVREIADQAHKFGATVVVDGAQGVPNRPTDVTALGADMLVFTGHKMCAPTGIGVLWGRYDLLDSLPPFLGGGEMIEVVKLTGSTFAAPPHRFEAGTQPIAQAVGLGAAIDYLSGIGMQAIEDHELEITEYALGRLGMIDGVKILGPRSLWDRGGAVSFTVDGVHPHDLMQMLDSRGIAVRGGQHCARPVHDRFGVSASTRMSSYLYTTWNEIDQLAEAVIWARNFFTKKA
jgi:cysteine desulfurase/selenocysteine lyase